MLLRKFLKVMYHIVFNFVEEITQVIPDVQWGNRLRGYIYKLFFKKCGKNLQVSKKVHFLNPNNIEFGDNVYIGYGCWIHGIGGITFEDDIMLGPYVCIVTGNHSIKNESYRYGNAEREIITIKSGSWIGAHSILLPGSKVERGSLLAAGGVLNKGTEEVSIYGGVPAKKLK